MKHDLPRIFSRRCDSHPLIAVLIAHDQLYVKDFSVIFVNVLMKRIISQCPFIQTTQLPREKLIHINFHVTLT